MRKFLVCIISIIAISLFTPITAKCENSNIATVDADCYTLANYINAERSNSGIAPYIWDDNLASDASIRAQEISVSFSHTRPDGEKFWTVGNKCSYGENLSGGNDDITIPRKVVLGFMRSPTHAANVLSMKFSHVGVAKYVASDGEIYYAVEFY